MKRILTLAHCLLPIAYCLLPVAFAFAQTDYTKYVDPFIGTGGHGHTYPGATVPFGMVQLSPDTRDDGSWDGCSGYHYNDSLLFGFSHTHLSGTGCSDYGDILLMPVTDSVSLDKKYSTLFHHQNEKASAGYYSVKLDNGITAELTATTRTGVHKYIFPAGSNARVILDLMHRDKVLGARLHIINKTTVEGYRRSEAWAKNQVVYFRIEFSKPFKNFSMKSDSAVADSGFYEGNIRTLFNFGNKLTEPLLVKVSISGVDEAGAKKNMLAEIPPATPLNFDVIKRSAHNAWQKELSKIDVSGGTDEQQKIFYTALYHCFLQPNIYNDVDGRYRGRDFQIHKAEGFNYYTVFSLWDTFRAWHPLMTIIDRKRVLDFIKTFLAQYEQGGMLPVWELSSNETECMIGYHSVSVIADAATKGITGFDMEKAFEAMRKSAETTTRYGLGAYIENGFLSVEDESESVSKTLEYSYDDWCIAQLASLTNHMQEYRDYKDRAQSWKNLFDAGANFIRPRKNGGWIQPFDASEVNNNFTEANAWQYTFFVPHEVHSLVDVFGSEQLFEKKLDELFTVESKTTGREQPDISGMIGQYAHGNEPSHHMAFLYNYVGKPWKTHERVRQILTEFYHAAPDGLIGNEDCGQMSAWYVMSSMGLYQVCPGYDALDIVPPLFPHVVIHLESGKDMTIDSKVYDSKSCYIRSILRNNIERTPSRNILSYRTLMLGGTLNYEIDTVIPSKDVIPETVNYYGGMGTTHPITVTPVITYKSSSFKQRDSVVINSYYTGDVIYYMLGGSSPTLQSPVYHDTIVVDSSVTIKAMAVSTNRRKSSNATARFYKMKHPDWKIKILSQYNPQYTAGGDEGLIDGVRGDEKWRKGNWQGYQSQDFECVIDMGKETAVTKFNAGFLQDTRAWILMPKSVEFQFSVDGNNFSNSFTIENTVLDSDYTVQMKEFSKTFPSANARYVKVKAVNYGKLPEWHQGFPYNGDAFIFVDEVGVE